MSSFPTRTRGDGGATPLWTPSVHAEAGSTDAALEFRPGGWQIKLAGSSAKGVLGGALLAGLLVAVGATGIPAAVVAALVPNLFDIEKVRLTAIARSKSWRT